MSEAAFEAELPTVPTLAELVLPKLAWLFELATFTLPVLVAIGAALPLPTAFPIALPAAEPHPTREDKATTATPLVTNHLWA